MASKIPMVAVKMIKDKHQELVRKGQVVSFKSLIPAAAEEYIRLFPRCPHTPATLSSMLFSYFKPKPIK